MNKELKKTIKFFKKNSVLIRRAILPVVIFCLLVTIIGIWIPKPNDNISPSSKDYLFENRNPNFNVGFGVKDKTDKQYVRFEARVGDNPFEENESNFWESFTKNFANKKGFEFGLSEVRFSETQSDISKNLLKQMGTAIEQMELDSITTNTEVIEVGRLLGEEDDNTESKKTVLNKNVYPGIDVEYQILEGLGVKEEIIIRDIDEYTTDCGNDAECLLPLNEFVFELKLDEGLVIKESMVTLRDQVDNKYYITDEGDNYIAHFLPTFAVDSAGAKTTNVDLDISHVEDDNYRVTVILNLDWLFSNQRAFPIRIDPSIVHDTTTEFDTGSDYNTEVVTGPKVQLNEPDLSAVDSSLEGYWKFEELSGSGDYLLDSSDNSNDGTPTGTEYTGGRIDNGARHFDGGDSSGDYISAGTSSTLKPTSALTLSAWVYAESRNTVQGRTVLSTYDYVSSSVTYGYNFGAIWSTDPNHFQFHVSGGGAAVGVSDDEYYAQNLNEWVHMVAVYSSSSYLRLYKNGVLVDELTSGVPSSISYNGGSFIIGRRALDAQSYFDGNVDEVSVYSAALTPAQVRELYEIGLPEVQGAHTSASLDMGSSVDVESITWTPVGDDTGDAETPYSTTSLVGQWDFNETSGTTADNEGSCGSSCDGTLTSFSNTTGQDVVAGSGWTSDNRRWGAGALMFDGSSDYVSVSNNSSLDFERTESFTLEAWFRTNGSISSTQTIVGKMTNSGTYRGYDINIYNDDLWFTLNNTWDTNCIAVYADGISVADMKWHYAVITYDGSSSASGVTIYIDGVSQSITTYKNTLTATAVETTALTIGSRAGGAYFDGIVDTVKIYSRVLTSSEILSNYQSGNIEMRYRTSTDGSTWGSWSGTETSIEDFDDDYLYGTSDSGLVSYWPMDESSGTSVDDPVGSNDGTASEAYITDGKFGKGRTFDGSNDYISVSDDTSLRLATSLTIEAWFRTGNSPGAHKALVRKDTLTGTRYLYGLDIDSSNQLYGVYYNGAVFTINSSITVNDGKWHHGAVTISGTSMKLYLDGQEVDSTTITGTQGVPTGELDIGASPPYTGGGRSSYFGGSIDEVSVWNTALGASGIYSRWRNGSSNPNTLRTEQTGNYIESDAALEIGSAGLVVDANTVGYWNMDDNIDSIVPSDSNLEAYWDFQESSGTGAYLLDKSDNSNDGDPSGTTFTTGKITGGRSFNGSSDYIEVPSHSSLQQSTTFSFSAWIYRDTDTGGWERIMSKSDSTDVDYFMQIASDDTLHCGNKDSSGTANNRRSSATIPVGIWRHVACVLDSSLNWHVYINGSLSDGTQGGSRVAANTSTRNVQIGRLGTGSTWYYTFQGKIDELSIYSDELSSSEISALYDDGKDIRDLSNYENHGLSHNSTYVKNGEIGAAREFDGDQYSFVDVPEPSSNCFDPSELSIETWLNVSTLQTGNFVNKGYNSGWRARVNSDGTITFFDRGSTNSLTTNSVLEAGVWYHIGITADSGGLTIYVNGVLDTSNSTAYGAPDTSSNLRIARYGTGESYAGIIDDLRISNRARTPAEIGLAYAMGRGEHVNQEIGSTDVSSNSMLPFWVASDQLGNNMDVIYGESDYANYEADDDTVGLWHLDEDYSIASSYYHEDSSGNMNYGDANGSAYNPPYPEGVSGLARTFNGTDGQIVVADHDSLSFSSGITAEAWFKIDSNTAYQTILAKSTEYALRYDYSTEAVSFFLYDGVDYEPSVSAGVEFDRWYHVAGVWDSTSDIQKLYLNGQLVSSVSHSFTPSNTANNLTIGSWLTGQYLSGTIDEVRVSDTARTPDEIRQTYELATRTHPITVDFKADLESSNLITGSTDKSFTISEQDYGTTDHIENIDIGEKIVVKENINDTEYIAQGDIDSINTSTGAVTVDAWDTGSTFPTDGYTTNATIFKWQREYIDIRYPLDEDINAITQLTFRKTSRTPAIFWIDDAQKATYSSDYDASSFSTIESVQYVQYQSIFTKWDPDYNIDLYISEMEINYSSGPTMDQLMRHGKWFNSSGEEQPFWWAQGIADDWELDYTNIYNCPTGYSNVQTVPADSTIYMSNAISTGSPTVYASTNGGSYTLWTSGTTKNFTNRDTIRFRVNVAFGNTTGTITLRENNFSGRVLDTFNYDVTNQEPCPG